MNWIRFFSYAGRGILDFFRNERNGRIQLIAAVLTIVAGWYFQIDRTEWMIVVICIGAVLSMEMLNTTLEKLSDMVEPNLHPQIKLIKDIAAGSVLIAALVSVACGLLIFLPKMLALI